MLETSVLPSGMERVGGGVPAHARCWVLRDRAALPSFGNHVETGERVPLSGPALSPAERRTRSRYRPYFENYTVDASILDPGSLTL